LGGDGRRRVLLERVGAVVEFSAIGASLCGTAKPSVDVLGLGTQTEGCAGSAAGRATTTAAPSDKRGHREKGEHVVVALSMPIGLLLQGRERESSSDKRHRDGQGLGVVLEEVGAERRRRTALAVAAVRQQLAAEAERRPEEQEALLRRTVALRGWRGS
jgi:hypothetical protein